ncbi:hypothetical protein GGI43DRAFT_165691 [Trichoderma evansii]
MRSCAQSHAGCGRLAHSMERCCTCRNQRQGLAGLAPGMVRGPLHLGHSKRWMKLARHASPPRHPLRNPLDGHPFWTQFPGVSNGMERVERSQRAHGRSRYAY